MPRRSIQMTDLSCAACGVPFSIPTELADRLRETIRTFYCPNGHSLDFTPGLLSNADQAEGVALRHWGLAAKQS